MCSLLQIRGSIPFRWKQSGLKAYEIVGKVDDWMYQFKQHFSEVGREYGHGLVLAVNLVAVNKKMELELKERFE